MKAILSGSTLVLPERRRRFRALWAIPVLLLLTLIATSVYLLYGRAAPIRSLAIMPFVNGSENPDAEYLSDGISESIVNSLSHVPNLRVMARDTVFTYKGQNDPRKIGRDLNVEAVVMGRVVQQGDTLVIRAHLVKVSDGSELWGEQYNRKLADVLAIQEEISREISNNLKLKLTEPEQKLIAKHHTENTEAYQLYLKGRYHWYKFTPEDYQKGLEYYQQAIDKDPSYALAYSGLAHSFVSMTYDGLIPPSEGCDKARSAASKAMDLDRNLAEAHFALGGAHNCDLDWKGGIEEYQRAIEMNPNFVEARRFLSAMYRGVGRWDEAIMEAKKAQELDPVSVQTNKWLAASYFWSGQYDRAIEQFHKTLELDPNHAETHDLLADVYARKGSYQEAFQEELKYLNLVGDKEGAEMLQSDFQSYGYDEARKRQHQRVLEIYHDVEKEQYVSPIVFATIFTQLGEKDQAFVWLEKAYQERSPWLAFIKTDPQFESLRPDPRFKNLMRRVGLP